MKTLKKILKISMVTAMMMAILAECSSQVVNVSLRVTEGEPVKVGVLLYKFDDVYISLVHQSLEEIQEENEGKVQFTFFDGKGDKVIQNESLDTLLENKDVDLLLVDLVDIGAAQTVISRIKENNIPVILFNREPTTTDAIKSYGKALYIGTDAKQAGILQGKILINLWNTNKSAIDKNSDNIMEYIMLEGEPNNLEAIARTKYSILTINEAGISTQQLALRVCNWEKSLAKDVTQLLFLYYGNKIEAIIANNDSMAIGAIEALKKYGYNNGDKTKTIPVVGVDAIPEAQELIKKGFMTGSVLQDPSAMAKALYTVGMNLVYNKNPLNGTEYKFDDTGVSIRLPYKEYIANNNNKNST